MPVVQADAADYCGVRFPATPERIIAAAVAQSTPAPHTHLPGFVSRLQRRRHGGKVCALWAHSTFVHRATRPSESVRSTAAPMARGLIQATPRAWPDDRCGKPQCEAMIQNTLVLRAFVLRPHAAHAIDAGLCRPGLRVRSCARAQRPCTWREEFATPGVDS